VTTQDTGALKMMSLPLTEATVAGATLVAGTPEQSGRGKQMAAAAVVILLLALAAAAYFALRGPGRTQVEPASISTVAGIPPPASDPSAATQPAGQTDNQQPGDDKKKAADARRQAEQEAAAIEAQKKATEAKGNAEKKDSTSQQPITSVTATQPAAPAPPPAAETVPPPAAGREGCVLVTVVDADGLPATGARVGLMDESDGGRFTGRTGPKGHWLQCGLTPGHSVRVAVLGPLGGLLNSQTAVVAASRTFVTIRVQKKLDEAPQRMPDRKGPFRRRP